MKKISLLLLITPLLFYLSAEAQWVTINSSRGNFSFSFPANTTPYDTLSLLSYVYVIPDDSTISFQVSYIAGVPINGNDETMVTPVNEGDPCFVDSIESVFATYAQMFQLSTEGTIEGFENSDYSPCNIRGRELTVRHPNLSGDEGYYFTFTRYFYWNGRFLAFTVSGPEEKLYELYSYKNQLFNFIVIY